MPISRNQQNKKKANRKPLTKDGGDKALEEKLEAKNLAARKERAQEHKAKGNTAFSAGLWLEAINCFTAAIEEDPSDQVFFSNRSAANLKLQRTSDAVDDAEHCVRLAPEWIKGHSRLGAALWADRQLKEAVEAFDAGLKLDPDNEQMVQSRKDVLAEIAAEPEPVEEQTEAPAQAPDLTDREPVIGIDLGTTYSAVAVWDVAAGGVRILADEGGNRTVPSYVGWGEDGERLIGHRAKAQAARAPKKTLFDVKRFIGSRAYEPAVQQEMKRLPFDIQKLEDDRLEIQVVASEGQEPKRFAPEEISAMVLSHMKEIAEKDLGREVKKAVITVPAYFNDAQRKATQAAGAIAGLEVLRIINEPTAAALGYGLDQKSGSQSGSHVLVFDLGGGTFDVSVLNIEGGIVEVKATGGDTRLGGEDFDLGLMDWLLAELKKRGHTDPDDKVRAKAKRAAEAAKRGLSSSDSVEVELADLIGEDGVLTVTRAQFEKICAPFFNRTLDTVKAVLKDAKLQPSDIDDIVLVGGSTRVPCIQNMLMEYFGNKALCKSINPDEAVAYGAAVQGAILSGVRLSNSTELLLIDVTPLSLGIETEGRHHSVIIPRNTQVPCTKESTYTTTENYQEAIDIRVYEGERPCTDSNHLLGEFTVTGIERAKKGEAQIVVRFALDANGVLNVSAIDKKTRAQNSCRINNACKGLDADEIKRMVKEAESMKASDADYAEKLEIRTNIEEAAYSLDDGDCDEILDWLANLTLSDVPKKDLERKLKEVERRGRDE